MKQSITVRLLGGLGNQLFQYALGRYLSVKNDCLLFLDATCYENDPLRTYDLDAFRINADAYPNKLGVLHARIFPENPLTVQITGRLERLFFPWRFCQTIIEKSLEYDASVLDCKPPVYLAGYWQCEKYFLPIRSLLLEELELKHDLSEQSNELAKQIKSCNAISLHVRRGDYISDSHTNQMHGTCSLGYYQKALQLILGQCHNPVLFVFSDDPQWVRDNIAFDIPTHFISHNGPEKSCEDLHLMSLCKHNITANSSFSWWGAWLNRNANKMVCCPRNWFASPKMSHSTIIPADWIQL